MNWIAGLTRYGRSLSVDLIWKQLPMTEKEISCIVSRSLSLLELDPSTLTINNIFSLRLEREKGIQYRQFESLVFVDGVFYLAASTIKKKKEQGTLFTVQLDELLLIPVADVPLWDISGLSFHNDYFYLISDDKDKLARYSLGENTFTKLKLSGNHQEGIASTSDSRLIVVSEDGTIDIYSTEIFTGDDNS